MVKLRQLKALVSIMAVIANPYQQDGELHFLITISDFWIKNLI